MHPKGLMKWRPHVDGVGETYPLEHLHPFAWRFEMAATTTLPARSVVVWVNFSLHTFTRTAVEEDDPSDAYQDSRETRTFCRDRYALSKKLQSIIVTVSERHCEFARGKSRDINYVTIELEQERRYSVFFSLRKWGADAIVLTVQSAYPLDPAGPHPGIGKIRFAAIVGHCLRGTHPHPPP